MTVQRDAAGAHQCNPGDYARADDYRGSRYNAASSSHSADSGSNVTARPGQYPRTAGMSDRRYASELHRGRSRKHARACTAGNHPRRLSNGRVEVFAHACGCVRID